MRYLHQGINDPGEAVALAAVAPQLAGDVLDLGVGAGRTTGLLAAGARTYVGVDIAPGMIQAARRRHPGVCLLLGDASDLRDHADDSYDLVLFSHNGLDALDIAGRSAALREMARVLRPGGRVVFSSLNRDGVSYDERPWRPRSLRPRALALEAAVAARHPGRVLRSVAHHRFTRGAVDDGPDWSRRPLREHEFRFLLLFATVPVTVALARGCGLVVEHAWDERAVPVDPAMAGETADWVHYVCRPASDS